MVFPLPLCLSESVYHARRYTKLKIILGSLLFLMTFKLAWYSDKNVEELFSVCVEPMEEETPF